jgi:pimeloyl-ACP methyl ester carboxylesterase
MISHNDPAWADGASFDGQFMECTVNINGLDIYYTDWNVAAPRTILMIHGFNVQAHTWDPIASVLSRQYRIICPDLRGHGRSAWTREGYWSEQFAGDLIGVLDQRGIREFDVVGHSLGVRVGIAIAGMAPSRVRSLLASDGGPELAAAGTGQSAKLADERAARAGFNTAEEALALYEKMHPEWLPVFRTLHVRHQLRSNWVGKLVELADPELSWITRSAAKKDNQSLWALARQVTAPTRLLWSEKAGFINQEILEKHRRNFQAFSDVRLLCGHYIPREIPWEFCNLAIAFLEENERARREAV